MVSMNASHFLHEKKDTPPAGGQATKNKERNETARSFHCALIKQQCYCGFNICGAVCLETSNCKSIVIREQPYFTTVAQKLIGIPVGKRAVIVFRGFFWLLFGQAKSDKKINSEKRHTIYSNSERKQGVTRGHRIA